MDCALERQCERCAWPDLMVCPSRVSQAEDLRELTIRPMASADTHNTQMVTKILSISPLPDMDALLEVTAKAIRQPILSYAGSPSDPLVDRCYARTGAVGIGSDIPARSASRVNPGAT
jgi:hypothetical protein